MKIVFIGCVDFSAAMLGMLLDHPEAELVGLVTREKSNANSDFQDLHPLAQQANVPIFTSNNNNQQEMISWLRARQADVIYCLGWSFLLSAEVLSIPPLGVVGYHPAALPQNRGRHPIIWALTLGLKQTASSFFLMDEAADSGDILSQVAIGIDPSDDAGSLYQKLIDAALPQLHSLTTALAAGRITAIPQDHKQANYWRKRSASDGRIDWRMSATVITNLVRALTRPYPGAHCEHNGKDIKIWRAQPLHTAPDNIEPGKVLKVSDGHILIKCGEGAVELIEHTFNPLPLEGSYL